MSDTISNIVERYLRHRRTQGAPPNTVQAQRYYLSRLGTWAGDRPLNTLTLVDLEDFVGETFGHLSYHTRRCSQSHLRAFYRWADKRGYADSVVAEGLEWPKRPRRERPTYYKPEQVAAILGQLNDPLDRLLATILVRHGQRVGRTISLQWRHVDFEAAVIHYPPWKGCKAMTMPLDKDTGRLLQAWRAISRYTDPDDWLFCSKRTRVYHRQATEFRTVLRAACLRAGVPYRGAHEFRRTLATTLLNSGVPLKAVSENVLGHSDVETTLRHYAGVDDDSVADSLRNLPF